MCKIIREKIAKKIDVEYNSIFLFQKIEVILFYKMGGMLTTLYNGGILTYELWHRRHFAFKAKCFCPTYKYLVDTSSSWKKAITQLILCVLLQANSNVFAWRVHSESGSEDWLQLTIWKTVDCCVFEICRDRPNVYSVKDCI